MTFRSRTRSQHLSSEQAPLSTRKALALVGTGVYLPTAIAEVGVGIMLPVLTLSVLAMDGSALVASLAVGAYALGRLGGSLWGGRLTTRWGARTASIWTLVVLAVGSAVCALTPGLVVFLVGATIVGVGHAAYHVARQSHITRLVPRHVRARALTSLAGIWRLSNFVGPLVGAAIIVAADLDLAYAVAAGTMLLAALALRVSPAWRYGTRTRVVGGPSLRHVITASAPTLRTIGVLVLAMGALRQGRLAVIPLWAAHVGMSAENISLVFAISAGVDMLLFYPAGAVMDRWGRLWTLIPSTALLALGTIMMPLSSTAIGVVAAAVVLGLGNGWGSGSIMVLGADLAPEKSRDTFIGLWMVLQDTGGLLGPLVITAGAAITLSTGFYALGVLGAGTSWGLHRLVPRSTH